MVDDEARALATSPLTTSEGFDEIVREIFPFDEATLDRLFDTDTVQFEHVLQTEAHELYNSREAAFTTDVMRKVERDVYLQILDNLWMQHLENMDHLKEGIHWMAVGQQDPLVEYRRRSQLLFDEMQLQLRHDIVRTLYYAVPIPRQDLDRPAETELTRAARHSVQNANQITAAEVEFEAADFKKSVEQAEKKKLEKSLRKSRKVERKRKTAARKRR
jgi:preprotein translocase subunit SecA